MQVWLWAPTRQTFPVWKKFERIQTQTCCLQSSCLSNGLALICCDMQLYVCIQNSSDADKQRRGGAHGLAARFVYVFRGESERESRRGKRGTSQTAASAACSEDFEIQLTCGAFSRGGCLVCVFSALPFFLAHASENVNKARC